MSKLSPYRNKWSIMSKWQVFFLAQQRYTALSSQVEIEKVTRLLQPVKAEGQTKATHTTFCKGRQAHTALQIFSSLPKIPMYFFSNSAVHCPSSLEVQFTVILLQLYSLFPVVVFMSFSLLQWAPGSRFCLKLRRQ